jgi:NitT/TauT family transport system permease protein
MTIDLPIPAEAPPVDAASEPELAAAWITSQRRERWRRLFMPLAGGTALLSVWWALVAIFHVRPFIAPSPLVVAVTVYQKFGMLMANLAPTALEALCGFLLGNIAAIAIATVFVHYKTVERAFFPIAVLIHAIPVVATAPILILLLGNGLAPKISIAAIICFFPTLVNMVRGLEAVGAQPMELMHVLSATPREVFFKLRVPTSLPFLFSALRIAASTATVGAIVGEWIGSQVGIGALIIQATYNFDSALLYATVLCGSCFSIAFFQAIRLIERLVVRWDVGVVG